METQTAVTDVMTDLRQQPNTAEQNIYHRASLIKDLAVTETKIIQDESKRQKKSASLKEKENNVSGKSS